MLLHRKLDGFVKGTLPSHKTDRLYPRCTRRVDHLIIRKTAQKQATGLREDEDIAHEIAPAPGPDIRFPVTSAYGFRLQYLDDLS